MATNPAHVHDVLRVICRIPVHRGQLVLYWFSWRRKDQGFTSEQVKEVLKFDQAKHRGLMAAFTRRIDETTREVEPQKHPGLDLFLRRSWGGDQNTYFPRAELLEAIQLLPKLQQLLDSKTIEEVVALPPQVFELPADVSLKPQGTIVVPPPIAPAVTPFTSLFSEFERAGLVFSSETVANVLLALQVKRFVILTGISGTGKTRIGQALANRFPVMQQRATAAVSDALSASIEVKPYMLKYHRFILPTALYEQLRYSPSAGKIRARFPGGELELTVSQNHAFGVLFKEPMKSWFKQNFQEGSRFMVRLAGPDGEQPDTLVFEVPAAFKEEPVASLVVVAVRPDWTDHRGLLGYLNPLSNKYVTTPFLELLLRADEECQIAQRAQRPPRPFFVLLDEMNLARVEHYFADFLSALESGEPLSLHENAAIEEGEEEHAVPRRLAIPPNLFLLGTVNVDETTYLFSPKVLDRAFTIEFDKVDLGGLSARTNTGSELDLVRWQGKLAPPLRPSREDWP
jgi:hypothetical protein